MVSGLNAYAMRRCSMKRKSIIFGTPNLPGLREDKDLDPL
jgi:hypothetical protein